MPGLEAHLYGQYRAGVRKLLIAGTMGLMPRLPDQTRMDPVQTAVQINLGRFELLIGATDHGTTRTHKRIEFLNSIDGVTVMTPGFYQFTAAQYESYERAPATTSRRPVLICRLNRLSETWGPLLVYRRDRRVGEPACD